MSDRWIKRSAAILIGGGLGVMLPEQARLWFFGALAVFWLGLCFWRPRDFISQLIHPEIILLGATVLAGFLYGWLGVGQLPEPLRLERIDVYGVVEDFSVTKDKASGIIRVEGLSGDSWNTGDSGKSGNSSNSRTTGASTDGVNGEINGQKYRLSVYPDKEGNLPQSWQTVRPGDTVSFLGGLERPKELGTAGGFDIRSWYVVRGLSGTITARGDAAIVKPGTAPLTWRVRNHISKALEIWDSEETGVLEGILFGDASKIPPQIQENYRVTGVLHVFAASGSNVVFVLALAWGILRFLPRKARILGSATAIIFYAALCGGNAPIVRATILAVAALLGKLGQGRVSSLRWLFLAAAGMFIANPLVLGDTGFQLSFAATWGIISLTPKLVMWHRLARLPQILRLAIATTLAAQIATFPILIFAFHRMSLIGLVANVFILFLLGAVLELGLVASILSFSVWLSAPLFQVAIWLIWLADYLLAALARLPWADVLVLRPGAGFWVLWYGGIGIYFWGWKRAVFTFRAWVNWLKWRVGRVNARVNTRVDARGFGAGNRGIFCPGEIIARFIGKVQPKWVGLVLLALFLWAPWRGGGYLDLTLIDVGQGDAILIETPERHAILIDAGPKSERYDAGERVVVPYLLNSRVKSLDALIITHEHQDHIGGAGAILNDIPVEWVGVPEVGERLYNKEWETGFGPMGLAGGEKIRELGAGDRIELDSGAWLEVLGPTEVLEGTHSDPNNNSLVLKLYYEGQTVLLTGDMEKEEMEKIAGTAGLVAEFYKQPHHGSRFSYDPELLDAVSPQAVFISVGKNSFGHPTKEVLNYWEGRQIPVYRTDEDGTIRLRLDKDGTEITTYRAK